MIDVKKFITGFLILAAAAGGSGFLLSYADFSNTPSQTGTQNQISINTATNPLLGNYFPTENPTNGLIAAVPATSTDNNNITTAFADAFINGVTSANPNGLTNDNGTQVLIHPDAQSVASQIVQSPALATVSAPDWNTEADVQPIKIIQSSSPSAVAAYSQSINNIVNEKIVANNVQNIINDPNITNSEIGSVEAQMKATLSDVLQIPTPSSLVPFQKSFVTMLVYDKNSLALAADPGSDPVKSILVFQKEEANYDAVLSNFEQQMQNASGISGFSFIGAPAAKKSDSAISFLDRFVGVHTADAQVSVIDWVALGQLIKKTIYNILLQIAKNTIMSLIQAKVLTWVQGSGAPRFVQDWANEAISAGEQAALNYIDTKMSCSVYSGWLPQIQTTLGMFYQNNNNTACADEFQAALGAYSFQEFQQYFQDGGFWAYGASNLPSGNMYGSLFAHGQQAGQLSTQESVTIQQQNMAGQGLKGSSACGDQSNPNSGTHTVCMSSDGQNYTIDNGDMNASGTLPTCDSSDKPVVMPNAGLCSDGEKPTVTNPPIFTGFASQSAIDSSPKLASAANDIAGLLNTVMGSLLSSLANLAVNSATNAINGGIWSLNSGSIQQSGTTVTPPSNPLDCSPTTQTVSSSIPFLLAASGGTLDNNGQNPVYYWSDSNNATSSGYEFSDSFVATGTYQIYLTDSTGDATSTCTITVVPAQ